MFERFTDRSRQTMGLANYEAQRLGHEYIGTEHILLGLVKEATGTAARVLRDMGVEPRRLREEVEKLVRPERNAVRAGKLPMTPVAKQALQYAVEEARGLRHDYVGTEHLLLGVLRDQHGIAAAALTGLGLKTEAIREAVLRMIGVDPAAAPPPERGRRGRRPADPGPVRPEWLLQRAGADIPAGAGLVLALAAEGHDRLWEGAIQPALEANGLTARRAEHVYESGVDPLRLQAELWSAAVVIADLGGRDPGTLFALGLCEALGRAPILLARSAGDLPVHLRSSRFIPYDPYELGESGIAGLRDRLTEAVRSFLAAVRPKDEESSD
jgi:hypothetical protein